MNAQSHQDINKDNHVLTM